MYFLLNFGWYTIELDKREEGGVAIQTKSIKYDKNYL